MSGLFVDAGEAAALLARGAVVLDTRGLKSLALGQLPGSQRLSWRVGVDGGPTSGRLGEERAAAAAFAAAGVDEERSVLVVGDWDAAWGEEGRVAWDLVYLGHPSVHILRGGAAAWPGPWSWLPRSPAPGRFVARPRPAVRASLADLRAPGALIWDVREADEYEGARRYGEAYGGHIPGAVHHPWRSLLRGPLPPTTGTVYTTCTGGVRSAMVWALLTAAGRPCAHHDGGWWEWSSQHPRPN